MFEPSSTIWMRAFLSSAAGVGEVAHKAPVVAWLRSDSFMASMVMPMGFDGGESVRMVTEKFAAAAEGAVQASMAVGAGMGRAMMTGSAPADLAFRIVDAAFEPTRRRVRENYDRLTTTRDD